MDCRCASLTESVSLCARSEVNLFVAGIAAIRTQCNVGRDLTFFVDRVLEFWHACIRAKSVGRLPQELHLALFPQGQPRRGLASQK